MQTFSKCDFLKMDALEIPVVSLPFDSQLSFIFLAYILNFLTFSITKINNKHLFFSRIIRVINKPYISNCLDSKTLKVTVAKRSKATPFSKKLNLYSKDLRQHVHNAKKIIMIEFGEYTINFTVLILILAIYVNFFKDLDFSTNGVCPVTLPMYTHNRFVTQTFSAGAVYNFIIYNTVLASLIVGSTVQVMYCIHRVSLASSGKRDKHMNSVELYLRRLSLRRFDSNFMKKYLTNIILTESFEKHNKDAFLQRLMNSIKNADSSTLATMIKSRN